MNESSIKVVKTITLKNRIVRNFVTCKKSVKKSNYNKCMNEKKNLITYIDYKSFHKF